MSKTKFKTQYTTTSNLNNPRFIQSGTVKLIYAHYKTVTLYFFCTSYKLEMIILVHTRKSLSDNIFLDFIGN